MARNKLISSLVIVGVLAASVSTSALAGDRGHHDGGNGAALAVGIIGAVVIGSLIANNSQPTYAAPQTYYEPQPVYTQPQPVYYQPQPVRQTYYEPAPYYRAQPVVYVDRDYYRGRHEYRHHHHRDCDGYRDGYYSR